MRRSIPLLGALLMTTALSVGALAQAPPAASAAPASSGSAAPAPASVAPSAAPSPAPAPTAASSVPVRAGADPKPAAATGTAVDGATFAVRLRDLEARVDELKEQIRRSHTRLAILSDTIMTGGLAGSRSEVEFVNEMSGAFKLVKALFILDGTVQFNRADDNGAMADQKEFAVFSGPVPPGDHNITVVLNFHGHGFGFLSYLRGYKFEVKSSHAFTALEGKNVIITAVAHEKGGVTTPLEQRPSVEWREKVTALTPAQAGRGSDKK